MDADRFDAHLATLTTAPSRRAALRLLGGLALAGLVGQTDAKKKKKRKKKCAKAGQTASEKRKKGKKKKGKKCCPGLAPDANGACVSPASPPPPNGCTPATCAANACGSLPDGCGGTLICGSCAGNSLCIGGVCQPCDVCPSGCFFSSVQGAIDFASSGETILICAGIYSGEVDIHQSLNLIGAGDGNGPGNTILDGAGMDRVVTIAMGVQTVALERLRITGGNTTGDGGGISSSADTLLVTDCTITGNSADGSGGGIENFSTLTLNNSAISGNAAGLEGGGIYTVTFSRTVALINSTVTENTADATGGGIDNRGTLTLTDSTVSGNTADERGGGIHNYAGNMLELSRSRVNGNQALTGGGIANVGSDSTLTLTDSTVAENLAVDVGGGIFNESGAVTLDAASRVTGNRAFGDDGGGVYNAFDVSGGSISLSSVANVSGNTPNDCRGDLGEYSGPGSVCTTT